MNIIGREKEINELLRAYQSKKAEFVAIYGRRRVGKTFLVNEVFKDKLSFSHTGLPPFDDEKENEDNNLLKEQLEHFVKSLNDYGFKSEQTINNWLDAFSLLKEYINSLNQKEKIVIFFDELPWMDTPRSNFLRELTYFWNSWLSKRDNILFIVCGSSASWMTNNLINGFGGLYDRITMEIRLSPLSLNECNLFINRNKTILSSYDVVQAYMIFGGIPYYMEKINPNLSLSENIDNLFFKKSAILRNEFNRLFKSCFKNPERMKEIVSFLATKSIGFSREEIIKKLNLESGGNITEMIDALMASDFIISYIPLGHSKRETLYKLIDPFCIFYLKFVKDATFLDKDFWSNNIASPKVNSWRGYAFENVCLNHVKQIKFALGISGVISEESVFYLKGADDKQGTQIDLLINRNDNVIDICEAKFYKGLYTHNKEKHLNLMHREDVIFETLQKKKTIRHVLITTYGLVQNEYSNDYNFVVTIEDLLRF